MTCGKRIEDPALLTTSHFSVTRAAISIAVPHTSPSPCAKWMSPVHSPAPSTSTGNMIVVPTCIAFTSMLPPFSRGGIVRSPSAAQGAPSPNKAAGTAPLGSGISTRPPAAASAPSRSSASATSGLPGNTPIDPGKRAHRDANIGQLVGNRRQTIELPIDDEWPCDHVAQEAESWCDRGIAIVVRRDVDDGDSQRVATLSALDEDRASHGMNAGEVGTCDIGRRRCRAELIVQGVACLIDDVVARARFGDRWQRPVKPIEAIGIILCGCSAPLDLDRSAHSSLPPAEFPSWRLFAPTLPHTPIAEPFRRRPQEPAPGKFHLCS